MVSTEDAKAIAIIAAGVGGIATVAYFVYSLANPGAKGGSCTTPGTPCYTATQPYVQEFQSCLTQYTQLMNQLITSGQAPTPAQSQLISQLRSCMDDAAKNITATAAQYVPTGLPDLVREVILGVFATVFGALGLNALLSYLKFRMSSGAITTRTTNGAGIAAVIYDGFVQYGAQNNLITSLQAAAWESAIGSFTSDETLAVGTYYNNLASLGLITTAEATTLINAETAALAADASTTIAILRALPMTAYERGYDPSWFNVPPPFYPELAQEAACGCR